MPQPQTMPQTAIQPLTGQVRRFGPLGVLYEIEALQDEDMALIRVIESGESLSYPIEDILTDPLA